MPGKNIELSHYIKTGKPGRPRRRAPSHLYLWTLDRALWRMMLTRARREGMYVAEWLRQTVIKELARKAA